MRKIKWLLLCGVLSFFYLQGSGLAETMYVTDRLYLSLREAPDLEQPLGALIESDTRVEVLETEDDWAKVALGDGRMGWVMRKYLVTDPPKSLIIEKLEEQIKKKSLTIDDLRGQINDMSPIIQELEEEVKNKSLMIEELQGQIRDKSLIIEESRGEMGNMPLILERLREENASLKKEILDLAALKARKAAMEREIEDLKKKTIDQNRSLETAAEKDSLVKRKEIYVIGIVALVVGLIIGYMVRRPDKNRFYLR